MKQMIFKRGTSLLLAIVMCFTTMAGLCTTAFATAEKGEAVLIGYPRGGDANRSEITWGHGDLTFMNGWFSKAIKLHEVYSMNSYSGNICYCIEPGTELEVGDIFDQKDETFFDNYPSEYNHTITPNDINLFFGRILQYGYTGAVSPNWMSQNPDEANIIAEVIATQILIWETVVGERDANFAHVSTGEYNAVYDIVHPEHPLRNLIKQNYDRIVSSVQKHTILPSFFSRSSGNARNIELEWNGSQYITVLTDTNNVLTNYKFSASDPNVKCTVSGNKLTITSSVAPSGTVSITATKNNSFRKGVIIWSDGNYAPGVGKQDTVSYGQEIDDPVKGFLNLKVSYGSAKIVKTSEDGKVDNITFTVTGNGVNKTVKTNSKGEFQIDNLSPGIYTVTEQTYDKYVPQESHRVTVVSGQTATVTFNNKLKRGEIQVTKSSEDKFNEGVKFHLYGTSLSGIAVDEYAVTDKNGIATFKDVLISGTNPYTIEEVDTDIRYVIPEKQTAPVLWKEVTSRSFTNTLKKFTVTVTKSDSETGNHQGNASLAGAKYGIFKGDQLVDEYYTNENGQFTSKEYVCGNDWTIKEIQPSEGYLLDTTIHKIGADAKLYTVEHNQTANDVTEQIIKGNIALIKHTDNGDTQIETPEEGAAFEIYLKSAGSYEAAKDKEREIITCDENGFAETKDMPYGIYTVHQIKGWEGRELMKDFDVFISQDAQTYRYLINNRNFESYVKVVKTDAETGKTIPYAGAAFQIYDPSGNLVTMTFTYPTPTTVDIFYTDSEGTLVTPEKLPYGKGYSTVEVQAPYGYILDRTPIFFDISEINSTEESGVTVIKVNKGNTAQKGTITVEKSGEVFFGVSAVGGSDENGNELPIIYQPLYETQRLSGAVYEIRAAEDIITPDGTLRVYRGEVVDTVTTGADGLTVSRELYLGKYEVQEITAPYGMVLNDEIHSVELMYAGQNVSVTETATSFYNERQKVEISLEKTLEINELFGIGNNDEITSISFGLFAAEDIISTSGTAIPADGLIEIITLDENGKATVKTDLPIGGYYVKELTTDKAYILNDTKYPVVFDYAGQHTAKVAIAVNNGDAIENKLLYGSVSGKKIDENGDTLGGALIGMFKTDEDEFTNENALMTTVSAEDGSFSFEKIPYGTWCIREIEPPTGFVLDETVYPITIFEDGQIIEIEIVNEFIRGNIALTKMDAEYPDNKLTGATFEVYKDSNDNGEFDPDDELIGTLTEKEIGEYEIADLIYGRYFVRESNAPEGFVIDTGVYEVFIDTDGMTYHVENKSGIGFINEPIRGHITLTKVDSEYPDNKLTGAVFEIYKDSNGNGKYDSYDDLLGTMTEKELGEYEMRDIRYGLYFVREATAPIGFVLDSEVYAVFIDTDEKVYIIENEAGIGFMNEPIRGNIVLTKVDAEFPDTKLTGATFEVYKDSNNNGKYDTDDEMVGTLTEKEIGEYEMTDLRYGRYFIKETKAPEGFILDTGIYDVFIDTDGMTYQVENKAGVGFVNEIMRGNLKIVKTSSDGKVKGFSFKITGANGYEKIFETDENGEILIEGLRIGEYTISEVNNSASSMYVLPDDKQASVQANSTTIVEMYNAVRETPQTGDTSNLNLWLTLAGLSVIGIVICGIIGSKKKEGEK